MNFQQAFQKGQEGSNRGLPLGPGLEVISRAINGLQRRMIYGIGAAPKVGKSTLCDTGFVIGPLVYAIQHQIPIEVIYLSFEIDRVSKEFDYTSYFLAHDHNIRFIKLDDNVTYKGKDTIEMSSNYLMGRLQDDNGNLILVKDTIKEKVIEVYTTRITKLFGVYNEQGVQVVPGYIKFIEDRDTPSGIKANLYAYARNHGVFKTIQTNGKVKITGYVPHDPNKYTIIITDHLRKLHNEKNFKLKQTIDSYIEDQVEIRNWCGFTFVDIIHLNRSMSDAQRARMMGDMLYPNSDDIKDTGNLSEEANHMFTMMNPNDDKYNLNKHFGIPIKDAKGNPLYPHMRSIHLVESRHVEYPQHFRVNMHGGTKHFEQLNIK